MAIIINDSGTARGVANDPESGKLDFTERRFVTFTDEAGAVHTIFVDVDHPITQPEALVDAWAKGELATAKPAPNPPAGQATEPAPSGEQGQGGAY